MARVEREVELVRTRHDGRLEWQKANSLVAAEFVHTASRLTRDQERGGVPDPQLHSHVVVLGAERTDARYAAVESRELFRSARANGAWYRAELAHHLQELGLEVRGRSGRGGRYFELTGVGACLPRASPIKAAACLLAASVVIGAALIAPSAVAHGTYRSRCLPQGSETVALDRSVCVYRVRVRVEGGAEAAVGLLRLPRP